MECKIVQSDIFEETLEKEIVNVKKWISRLQKRIWFLEEVYERTREKPYSPPKSRKVEQLNFFETR